MRRGWAHSGEEFFGSFFQKRTAFSEFLIGGASL
jgi:hypothetical protein